jgi:hypothetical protein
MSAPDPDVRMQLFVEYFDYETRRPVMMSLETLKGMARRLPTSTDVPHPIQEQLRVARELLIHSYFVYEFAAIAVAWSLMAVESALRERLDLPKTSYAKLIAMAHQQGLIASETAQSLDAGRKTRNNFSHPQLQPAWSYGMVIPALQQSHAAVAEIYSGTRDG